MIVIRGNEREEEEEEGGEEGGGEEKGVKRVVGRKEDYFLVEQLHRAEDNQKCLISFSPPCCSRIHLCTYAFASAQDSNDG